jgi:hypothetical protein
MSLLHATNLSTSHLSLDILHRYYPHRYISSGCLGIIQSIMLVIPLNFSSYRYPLNHHKDETFSLLVNYLHPSCSSLLAICRTFCNCNYKEFYKLLINKYRIDLANELRRKISRLCGGDGCVEWVSVAGDQTW